MFDTMYYYDGDIIVKAIQDFADPSFVSHDAQRKYKQSQHFCFSCHLSMKFVDNLDIIV